MKVEIIGGWVAIGGEDDGDAMYDGVSMLHIDFEGNTEELDAELAEITAHRNLAHDYVFDIYYDSEHFCYKNVGLTDIKWEIFEWKILDNE